MDTPHPSAPVMAPVPATGPGSRFLSRPLIVLVVAIIALALLAAAAVIIASRPAPVYPAGSPEAELQTYLQAYRADDLERAYACFSSDVQARMSLAEFRIMAGQYRWQNDQDRRIVLDATRATGPDRVTIDATIEYVSTNVFGTSRWTQPLSVRLVREQGAWRIDDALVGTEPAPYPGP